MAKLERYNSFEEMDEALVKEQKASYHAAKPDKVSLLQVFAEKLRKNIITTASPGKKS